MNPVLTIWTSDKTTLLAAKTAALQSDAAAVKLYDSINIANETLSELTSILSKKYRELITLTATDTTLHSIAIIPLFDNKFESTLQSVSEAVKNTPDKISLHVIALRKNLARILDNEIDSIQDACEISNIRILDEESQTGHFSYTILDDYVESGAPLDFTLNSLSEYLAFIFSALCANYHCILPPALVAGTNERNIAIGISSYRFNRKGACSLLLHKAFIRALEKAGVDQETVDTQKCLSIATALLAGINRRYEKFYKKIVEPLYRKGDLSDGDIAAQVGEPLKKEMLEIKQHLNAIISREDLSLPEKEGILALVLGQDNAKLQGVQYDQSTMLLDDVCCDPIDIYITTFNEIPVESSTRSLLPVRGNYARLKKYTLDLETGKREESYENKNAFNPLPAIKKLKREILDTTSFIRRKSDQLQQLESLDRQRIDVEKQNHRYFPPVNPKTAYIKEQPLDERYSPPAGLKPKESVDLRCFFSEVRNQGNLGSCTTFAVVSMYESIVNRLQNRGDDNKSNLSEQFIYHYSNVVKGRPEGGSNFYEQLEVLGTKGICDEALFGYTSGNMGTEPSEEAIEEAANHRVLKALQIQLHDTGDKLESITLNHRLLTSALTEGHPVGIALKLYDSFGKNGAYVNRPSESEIAAGESENHAMVIVGYSEENKCYIVRNSWGEGFGDNGYCYISSTYIDDPDFNMFSCIITETTESGNSEDVETPGLIAPFAGTQAQIEMAAIRNVLDEAHLILKNNQQLYDDYYRYYSNLMQRLCVPQTRNLLRQEAESECLNRLLEITTDKSHKENSFIDILKNYKFELLKRALKASGAAVFLTAMACVLCFAFNGIDNTTKLTAVIIAALSIFIAICFWIDKISRQRKKRLELKEDIEHLAVMENRVRKELLEKQLQYHVAGMWIDSFHDLQLEMGKTYHRLQSFNSNLRCWMNEDKRALASFAIPEGAMFISLGDPVLFEKYFNDNLPKLLEHIDLNTAFNNYSIDSETIQEARTRLLNEVENTVGLLFKDFRMFDFLTGLQTYPYVKKEKIDDLIGRMINLGQPASRHHAMTVNFPIRLMLVDVSDSERRRWNDSVERHFPSHADVLQIQDPDSFTLLTIRPLPADAIR